MLSDMVGAKPGAARVVIAKISRPHPWLPERLVMHIARGTFTLYSVKQRQQFTGPLAAATQATAERSPLSHGSLDS